MQKSEVSRVSKCKFNEKISSGHNNKMGAKDDGKVKTYEILIYVFVNLKKVRNLWVEIRVTHDASKSIFYIIETLNEDKSDTEIIEISNQNDQMQDIKSFKTNPNSDRKNVV